MLSKWKRDSRREWCRDYSLSLAHSFHRVFFSSPSGHHLSSPSSDYPSISHYICGPKLSLTHIYLLLSVHPQQRSCKPPMMTIRGSQRCRSAIDYRYRASAMTIGILLLLKSISIVKYWLRAWGYTGQGSLITIHSKEHNTGREGEIAPDLSPTSLLIFIKYPIRHSKLKCVRFKSPMSFTKQSTCVSCVETYPRV